MTDLQKQKPENPLPLKVGIKNAKKAIHIKRDNPYELFVNITANIELSKHQRGAHMSRFLEVIENLPSSYSCLEEFVERLTHELELKHESIASVTCESEFPYESGNPKKKGVYPFVVQSLDSGKLRLTVKSPGMSACPCVKSSTGDITHSQRAIGSISIEYSPIEGYEIIPSGRLVDVLDSSFSAPVYPILKRKPEVELVKRAHANCRFAEDIVRTAVDKLKQFEQLENKSTRVEILSFDSVHPHDIKVVWQGVL